MQTDWVQPVTSGENKEPDDPDESEEPDDPEAPGEPDDPEEPDAPDEPDDPEEPDEPDAPESEDVTVTWKDTVAVLLWLSDAVQVTVVVPIGNRPLPWSQWTPTEPSTASAAVGAVNDTEAPDPLVAATVTSAGVFEITGGVVSVGSGVIVTANDDGGELSSLLSYAVHWIWYVPTVCAAPEAKLQTNLYGG